MSLRKIAAFFPLMVCLAGASAQQTPAVFPYEPAQLLGVLPAPPSGWKMIRSDADESLGEWLETRATRVFQAPPDPVGAEPTAAAAPPLGEIEIGVVDTAGFAPALASFANFTLLRNGNFEKKRLGTLPAIVITNDDGKQTVQVLVLSRYLISLVLTNLPRQRAEDWLKTFHFETLPPASKTPGTQPREFRLSRLDELHPENNRSYAVSTTSAGRVDAFLKTLPPAPPEPAGSETGARPTP